MLLEEIAIGGAASARPPHARAASSMLGISWGIVSVVVLLAYGEGFRRRAAASGSAGAFGDGAARLAGQTSMQAGGERAGAVRLPPRTPWPSGELPS